MSEANRVSLKSLAEATYGTTPVNSNAWQMMRFTSQSIAAVPKTVMSDELRYDRHVTDLILVGQEVKGDVGFELSEDSYDEWLAAAMCSTWSTNVLKQGVLKPSFSLEVGFEDWSPVQYLQYKGMRIGGFDLGFAFGEVVKGSFNWQGNTALQSTTSLRGTGTAPLAAPTTEVMDASAGLTAVTIDGGAPVGAIKRINIKLENNLRPIEGVGSATPTGISYGRGVLTGSLEMYFESAAMYTKLLAGTTAALSWTVAKNAKSYQFTIPKLKFNSGNPPATGVDTDVMINLEFTGLYDGTALSNLVITRVT